MRRHHVVPLLLCMALLAACGGGGASSDSATAGGAPKASVARVRLGYFANLTHATALVGVREGIFQKALGDVKLEVTTYNAGPAATEALVTGALDATYVGPNPAINAFVRTKGAAVRIVSGATSGGAFLVVRPGITTPAALKGKRVATPQLGNTQDVALRAWLSDHGLKTNVEGGGDVAVVPQENPQTLETFKAGAIDGAWVPEPWATRLIVEAGATVLVDESTLWPDGRYVTTHLMVRKAFLDEHADVVERLIEGQVEANAFVNARPDEARRLTNEALAGIVGKPLPDGVVDHAWTSLTFTNDPVASSLRTQAAAAKALGFLKNANLDGIYDLTLLNEVLQKAGGQAVAV